MRKRKGRRRAVGTRAPLAVAVQPNARWSLDFVHDQLACGRRFRVLNVVDDATRECLLAVADTSISGKRVARELTALITRRGRPRCVSACKTESDSLLMKSDGGVRFSSEGIFRGLASSNISPPNRRLVPFSSFCEYKDTKPRKTATWFAADETRPASGLRRGLDAVARHARHEGRSGRGRAPALRLLDLRAEHDRRADPPQGDAGDPDDGGGEGGLARGALGARRARCSGRSGIVARGLREDPSTATLVAKR